MNIDIYDLASKICYCGLMFGTGFSVVFSLTGYLIKSVLDTFKKIS